MKKLIIFGLLFTLTLTATMMQSCNHTNQEPTHGDWIKGTEEEKMKTIEKQFRGFDNAMVETGYRYQELYWAGQDENWDYATYQLDKIKMAIENGLQRRPKRAKSAGHFLTYVLPEMQKSINSNDPVVFNQGFQMLKAECKLSYKRRRSVHSVRNTGSKTFSHQNSKNQII